MIIGSGEHKYEWNDNWARLPETQGGRRDKAHHGVVVTEAGEIMIFYEDGPSVLTLDKNGNVQRSWDSSLTNAHGMALVKEGESEYLWLADNKSGQVVKTTLDGQTVMSLQRPDLAVYRDGTYSPTWIAVNEERHGGNGDIWVTDGYGESYVHRYDKAGHYMGSINGEEGDAGPLDQPHGIWIDNRGPEHSLYISDRRNGRVQVYDLDGNFRRAFGSDFLNANSPSGFLTYDSLMIVVELRARLTLIDAADGLVTYLGDNPGVSDTEGWPDISADLIKPGKFNSPHGVAADSDGSLYIVEFITGGRMTKLSKV